MKKLLLPILIAACLWFIMFSPWTLPHLNFWIFMSFSAVVLIFMSFKLRKRWKDDIDFNIESILFGAASACLLWLFFYIGNYLSTEYFNFAKPQIASIYGLRDGTNKVLIALALFFLIGPAEVIFWQGLIQSKLMQRYGDWTGFFITAIIYTSVHIFSFNLMLIAAAFVCGTFWSFLYMFMQPRNLVPILVSHVLWDIMIFVLFPVA